ncbi:hypothetical protein F2Q69_00043050 [Brassica cretica]|uniref:Uncharacterized protein n=1 Tax=Brassica cretica TaxID=69181 RepID=A0A8S9NA75_BRACR|nr:hypothetical protein F2Q69_00043050 [Brassica cretica]
MVRKQKKHDGGGGVKRRFIHKTTGGSKNKLTRRFRRSIRRCRRRSWWRYRWLSRRNKKQDNQLNVMRGRGYDPFAPVETQKFKVLDDWLQLDEEYPKQWCRVL